MLKTNEAAQLFWERFQQDKQAMAGLVATDLPQAKTLMASMQLAVAQADYLPAYDQRSCMDVTDAYAAA